jgi:hypothetical protein
MPVCTSMITVTIDLCNSQVITLFLSSHSLRRKAFPFETKFIVSSENTSRTIALGYTGVPGGKVSILGGHIIGHLK